MAARSLAFLIVCLTWLSTSSRPSLADEVRLTPTQDYRAERSHSVVHDSELRFTLTAPYKTKLLRVWIPIPPSDHAQQLLESKFTTFPESVQPTIESESVYGNKFAYFEFENPQGAVVIAHHFKLRCWELNWQLDPAELPKQPLWPRSFNPYLRNESQSVATDDRFEKLLATIVPKPRNPLLDLKSVMTFADRNFTYDHVNASLKASSVHALEERTGHCSDYHGFCAAMGRLMNQPTRVTYGLGAFPKASPSHCKLEAYLHPVGWVSFDVSETQKLVKSIRENGAVAATDREGLATAAQNRLVEGYRENSWILQTRGSDYHLAPQASRKVAVVRTLYAEADGRPLAEPDPSNRNESAFSWMTAHRYKSQPKVGNTFKSLTKLRDRSEN